MIRSASKAQVTITYTTSTKEENYVIFFCRTLLLKSYKIYSKANVVCKIQSVFSVLHVDIVFCKFKIRLGKIEKLQNPYNLLYIADLH